MAYISKFTGAQIDDLLDKSKTMGAAVDELAHDVAAKEDAANKVTSITASADDTHYPSAKAVKTALANLADGEDLASVGNVMKLADKAYAPTAYSGMGRKYLRKNLVSGKNILTQEMLPSANTIYIIQYDYDLNGATITIPENCILDFQGGGLGNGSIVGNNTIIISLSFSIFVGLNLSGSFDAQGLTPKWFGAIGDGVSDDTNALRQSLLFSHNNGSTLHINQGEKYVATSALNYIDGEYKSLTLNIKGCLPAKTWEYNIGKYGGISVASGVSLFENATITGIIENVSICGKREDDIYLFNGCECKKLCILNSNISQFGCVFYNSGVSSTSYIGNCVFLTVYRFSENTEKDCEFTDSTICGCYINGGVEKNNNDCFGWANYNGSTFVNNFIDYYRCIYMPKFVTKRSNTMLPMSVANNYQVFRYLYVKSASIITITFNSVADVFNWNDISSLDKLANFEALQYKGQDGNSYDMPPYIAASDEASSIKIKNAYIQRYIGTVIFYKKTVTNYVNDCLEFDVITTTSLGSEAVKLAENSTNSSYLIYGGGNYKQNYVDVKNVYRTVTELPWFAQGWCLAINGERVVYNNEIYRAMHIYDSTTGKYVSRWVKENQYDTVKTGASRPATKNTGQQFFDTTLNKPIWWNGSAWVDATGATV